MKIISLNAWCGRMLEPLLDFVRRYRDTVDVFCFQEVLDGKQSDLEARHPGVLLHADLYLSLCREFRGFLSCFARFDDNRNRMSVATFVRSGVCDKVVWDQVVIHKPVQPVETGHAILSPRKILSGTIHCSEKKLVVTNYHGLWTPDGKRDSTERIDQSWSISKYLSQFKVPHVLCGDLNLEPDTDSLAIIRGDMQDLIHDYKVTSTRTPEYREHNKPGFSRYADYVFASPEVRVREFRVLPDVVSDHAPLYVEITF